MLINYKAVENLAQLCSKYDVLLIHVSTDYVFNGMHFKPYEEIDPPAPDSYYGLTKLKGEEAVLGFAKKSNNYTYIMALLFVWK